MSEAETIQVLTTSRMREHRRCKRSDFFKYEQLYRPIKNNENLQLGTLVHGGLEAWWLHKLRDQRGESSLMPSPLQTAVSAMRAELAKLPNPEERQFSMAKAEAMLIAYHERWAGAELEVLGVEVEFTAPLINPSTDAASRTFKRAGKLDAIVRLPDGRVMVVEHKTTSEDAGPGSDYQRRLLLDSQVSDYYVGARALGYDPQGCLYDILGKPTIKPSKATPMEKRKWTKEGKLYAQMRESDESPSDFFDRLLAWYGENSDRALARVVVVRLEDDEVDAAHDFYGTARDIREAQLSGRWPRNPEACVKFGETCAFFDVCTRVANLTDTNRFRKATKQHEELTQ